MENRIVPMGSMSTFMYTATVVDQWFCSRRLH